MKLVKVKLFKLTLVFILSLSLFSAPLAALDPLLPPGKNIDLSAFKLQTIDDANGRIEISPEQLRDGYTQRLFYTDKSDGAIVFDVVSNGGTTPNTKYSRTELRQVGQNADWSLTDPRTHYLWAKMKVLVVAEAKPQTIIGQIHGSEKDSEMVKLRWNGYQPGRCSVEARLQRNNAKREEFGVQLASGLSLGDEIEYTITMKAGEVVITLNGKTATHLYTEEFYGNTDKYYFKAGNYLQYNAEPAMVGKVKMYGLRLEEGDK